MHYNTLQEEELKIRIAEQFFADFDCGTRIGKIDFCVVQKPKTSSKGVFADISHNTPTENNPIVSLLWAEAKRGTVTDIYKPLVQLILTIGKARTFDTYLPPPFLAAFDAEKIAFLPYREILPFLALNDFNWNVTSSDTSSREFGLLYGAVRDVLDRTAYVFRYDAHEKELQEFIKQHLSESSSLIQINKNNFVSIYQRWLTLVQPSIDVNWDTLKKLSIIDGDFFLADLLSSENQTIKEALFVLLQDKRYVLDRKKNLAGIFTSSEVFFKDGQKAHSQFWSLYQRPPREEYWDYIIKRRDLLVPQDVRERKGSFFTPKIWVDLSQKYLADVLGENWQDEYYVWDCAAGTGNLLNGLTNKYNIWASTLDQQDVDVMKDRIKNGANLLESHVFQFDFLNDEFDGGKLPADLLKVILDPEKRKKLVIYINPPYAEAGNARTVVGTGENRSGVAKEHTIHKRYREKIGKASNELFALFLARIYDEIPNCWIAEFSKLKILQSSNFSDFRTFFRAALTTFFLVPAATFDNVNGNFPIGFLIWNTAQKEQFTHLNGNCYDHEGKFLNTKHLAALDSQTRINAWITPFDDKLDTYCQTLGYMGLPSPDFQHCLQLYIAEKKGREHFTFLRLTSQNLAICCVYFTVRLCIPSTWFNDRDQFLTPHNRWEIDQEFQNNCLVFTLFHGQNRIMCRKITNHWIPFTEEEVNAQSRFESHFMTDFMAGKLFHPLTHQSKTTLQALAEEKSFIPSEPLVFSAEATAVFDAGRELWRYYHAQPDANPNASYYDIREHFQGRNEKGKMNPKSDDAEYMCLLANLKDAMEALRQKIVPKVYDYGFLKE